MKIVGLKSSTGSLVYTLSGRFGHLFLARCKGLLCGGFYEKWIDNLTLCNNNITAPSLILVPVHSVVIVFPFYVVVNVYPR